MNFQAFFLAAMVIVLSGFTWGSSSEEKKVESAQKVQPAQIVKKSVDTVRTEAPKAAQTMVQTSYGTSNYSAPKATYLPEPTTDNRASAVRLLTSGDEATRKARLESLSRVAQSLSKAKEAREKAAYRY